MYNEEIRLFDTTQERVVIPTNELIKEKKADFRVLLAISTISNVERFDFKGDNKRYVSLDKFNRNKKVICESIGISTSQLNKHINTLIKCGSEEFKLVEYEHEGEKVWCYEINYKAGGFVTIPYDKVEKLVVGLSNNCIKLYSTLLWVCCKNGEIVEKAITQEYLLKQMGLSTSSQKVLKIATDTLREVGLINVRKEMETDTLVENGVVKSSKPKTIMFYSVCC